MNPISGVPCGYDEKKQNMPHYQFSSCSENAGRDGHMRYEVTDSAVP